MGNFFQEKFDIEGTELSEYNGQTLSSIYDFRENSIKGTQQIQKDEYQLNIIGLVNQTKTYTYDQVINNFQNHEKLEDLDCVEGWSVKILWKGIKVKDLIETAEPQISANTIIFYAKDGYSTSFPIDYITDKEIIMAYKINNVTIPPERGFPFQLVAESKWGYKWIKWITTIELSDNPQYRGYWEQRGYSNDGDLDKSFFE